MKSLFSYAKRDGCQPKSTVTTTSSTSRSVTLPCGGLSDSYEPLIRVYLDRVAVLGGGGSSVTNIANRLFGKAYRLLKRHQKETVRAAQISEHRWRNDQECRRVFAVSCQKTVSITLGDGENISKYANTACDHCRGLLQLKDFKKAIKRPLPLDENLKYTNKMYRSAALADLYAKVVGLREILEAADSNPPCIRYAIGVLSGKFKEETVFAGLIQAMVQKMDKDARGVNMRNFQYAPELDEFMHIINIHSPRAYRFLAEHLPLRTERSLRAKRAEQPRFPVGIQERTFELAEEHIKALDYAGPVGLSCDDSKLLPAFRLYLDPNTDQYYIVGNTGEPLLIANPEEFSQMLKDEEIKKAEKLRLWCLQLPLPKMTPIVIAGLAIPNDLDAETLSGYARHIIDGLLNKGIKVVSYACDGTSVERSVQRILTSRATKIVTHIIAHPVSGVPDLIIKIPFFEDQPIVMIQDSKHGLKTYRNNLFSGARLLVLGNYIACYSQARAIAFENGPLYNRDVEKLDRQDDNAATRLFSADTLKWLADRHPESIGIMIYLFVFGELIDAYQSREISISERLQMALRAHFFINIWKDHIEAAGYARSKYFLSAEATDITSIIIHGLIQLIYVYRDHLNTGGQLYPLLPWLHSSEACEHVFGICRQIIQDFTMLDFIHMVPKLSIRLREAVMSSRFTTGKATASGYNHTYVDHRGLNLVALGVFPTDTEINSIALRAHEEAVNLTGLLGITSSRGNTTILPSIRTWSIDNVGGDQPADADTVDDEDDKVLDEDEEACPGEQINHVLDELESTPLSLMQEDTATRLTYASVALTVQESMNLHSLPVPTEDERDEAFAADSEIINQCLTDTLPTIRALDELRNACDITQHDLDLTDFHHLVKLRFSHQTKQAKNGVRTSEAVVPNLHSSADDEPLQSKRVAVLRQFQAIIKEQQERGIGTGAVRSLHWKKTVAPTNQTTTIDGGATGNSANARQVASAAAAKMLAKRVDIYKRAKVPAELQLARITPTAPLRSASYANNRHICMHGFIVVNEFLMLAKIENIYTKSGAKNAAHAWTDSVDNIAAVSHIAVQAYENMIGPQFRAIPQDLAALQSKRFLLIPSSSFLCALHTDPSQTNDNLTLKPLDYELYKRLRADLPKVLAVTKSMSGKSRARKGVNSRQIANNDDEEE